MVLRGNACEARSLSFLSIIADTELDGSLKFMLNPDVVVMERFVDPDEITLDTSALSKMPRSDARSFSA